MIFKCTLLIVGFLFLSFDSIGQSDTLHFLYNENWKEVKKSKNATYHGTAFKIEDGRWKKVDSYKSGTTQMIGYYKDRSFEIRHGRFYYFYENGNPISVSDYRDNLPYGQIKLYRENGTLKYLASIDPNTLKPVDERYYREDGAESAFLRPQFVGGESAMYEYLKSSLKYPKSAQEKGWEGYVLVGFTVKKDGNIDNASVVKATHSVFINEAIRVVESMPMWIPGVIDGEIQEVEFRIPVVFRLE